MLRPLMLGFATLLLLTSSALGQSNEEKYKKKLEKPFVKKIEWIQSLEQAQKIAKETGKPIFGYFTRSYSP